MSITGHSAPRSGKVSTPQPLSSTPHINGPNMAPASPMTEEEEIARAIRKEVVELHRPSFATSSSPIRTMARMVAEAQSAMRKAGISPEIIKREVVNRSIGDVNVRMITEKIDGVDYTTIGEDLGLILPGEKIGGRISTGEVHRELTRREEEIERRLLDEYNWDMRVYDVYGVGNPLLREKLAARSQKMWGIPADSEQTFISIGALDALYKSIMALSYHFRQKYGETSAFAFPAPGFGVVNWQVVALGLKLVNLHTSARNNFKLNYAQMKQALTDSPDLRFLYFTVSNNPTAFSYSYDEIREVYRAIEEDGREFVVLADLAYIGTGDTAEDRASMAAFDTPFALNCTLFINSLSKVFTLTGDRCGWVSLQNKEWAELLRVAWNNTTAGLPAEWQLRFTAYVEWFDEHPEIQEKIKSLYNLRRERLRQELRELNAQYDLFEEVGLDDHTTIYNWSKLKPGKDALSLFETTGLAGVSGRAFGYDDEYIRFSVGFIPVE